MPRAKDRRSLVMSRGLLPRKIINIALSLLICLLAIGHSQERPPQLLIRAAHCLEVDDFLPPSNTGKLTFGYLLDEQSYPGDKVIYVVAFASLTRSDGLVLAVWLTEHDGRQVFDIQNNASFVLSKHEPIGVSFVTPPLGGTWTQEHLASAIKQIEKQPRFTIPVKDLLAADALTDCASYTDR
jgi:hypothetical protein